MDKAKEKALQEYPEELAWDYRDMDYDPNQKKRVAYEKGYRQAEKDIKEELLEWLEEHRKSKKKFGVFFWGMRTAIGQIIDKVKSL